MGSQATVKAMQLLDLEEHADHDCKVQLSWEQRRALRSEAKISVRESQSAEGHYVLRPSSHVGVVNVGDLSVIIRPKVKIDRVMFMITYAMDPDYWSRPDFTELAQVDDVSDILEAVALSFTHYTKQAIGQGLLRGYRREEDALNTVRGQIRFSDQIRRKYDLPLPIEVTYDEYTEDIEQNRLLKTALHRLSFARMRNQSIADEIRRLRPAFDMVQLSSYAPGALPTIRYTRLDEHYRPAVELARFIIENTTPDLSYGEISTASFVIDMNQVFEKFVYVALRETLKLSENEWRRGKSLALDKRGRIGMEPDLSWYPSGSQCPCFVGDAKYKKLDEESFTNQRRNNFRHADIYQMLAYCTAAGLRSGLLIYAAEERETGASPEPELRDEYKITDVGTTIEVTLIKLSGTPINILGEVGRIAARVRKHSGMPLTKAAA